MQVFMRRSCGGVCVCVPGWCWFWWMGKALDGWRLLTDFMDGACMVFRSGPCMHEPTRCRGPYPHAMPCPMVCTCSLTTMMHGCLMPGMWRTWHPPQEVSACLGQGQIGTRADMDECTSHDVGPVRTEQHTANGGDMVGRAWPGGSHRLDLRRPASWSSWHDCQRGGDRGPHADGAACTHRSWLPPPAAGFGFKDLMPPAHWTGLAWARPRPSHSPSPSSHVPPAGFGFEDLRPYMQGDLSLLGEPMHSAHLGGQQGQADTSPASMGGMHVGVREGMGPPWLPLALLQGECCWPLHASFSMFRSDLTLPTLCTDLWPPPCCAPMPPQTGQISFHSIEMVRPSVAQREPAWESPCVRFCMPASHTTQAFCSRDSDASPGHARFQAVSVPCPEATSCLPACARNTA